jgi:hypothetical protein
MEGKSFRCLNAALNASGLTNMRRRTDAKTIDFKVILQKPFPPYQTVLDQIKPILLAEKILGVLFIDCAELRWIEQFYGRNMYTHIIP